MFRHAGRVDRTISADTRLYAAFRDGERRTYVAYNARGSKRMVHFSDGTSLQFAPGAFGILNRRKQRSESEHGGISSAATGPPVSH